MPPEGSHDGASFFVCFLGGHTFSFSCDDSGVTFPPVSPVSCPTFRFHFCVPLISCYLLSRISPISLFCLQPQSAGIACATQPVDKVGWQQSDVLSRTAHKVENHRMLRPHARDPPPRPSHTVPCPSTEGRSSTPARSRSFCAHRTPSPVRWSPNGAHLTTLATDWSLPCPLAPTLTPTPILILLIMLNLTSTPNISPPSHQSNPVPKPLCAIPHPSFLPQHTSLPPSSRPHPGIIPAGGANGRGAPCARLQAAPPRPVSPLPSSKVTSLPFTRVHVLSSID